MPNTDLTPEVGMGATYGIGADAYAYTVTAVIDDKTIAVRRDEDRVVSGSEFTNNAKYEFKTRGPLRHLLSDDILTLRKNGRWVRKGVGMHEAVGFWHIGHRSSRRDPSY